MNKKSYPPIFSAGFHDLEFDEIKEKCVDSFSDKNKREFLFNNLKNLLDSFFLFNKANPFLIEVWIDGSFTTFKPEPDDIDILLVYDDCSINSMPLMMQTSLYQLLDRNFIKINYNIDVLQLPQNNPNYDNDRSYWRGWFGFDRNENAKGVVRIKL